MSEDIATLFSEQTSQEGVIRLVRWPEGYVLWHHGRIVWKSWEAMSSATITVRLEADTQEFQRQLSTLMAGLHDSVPSPDHSNEIYD